MRLGDARVAAALACALAAGQAGADEAAFRFNAPIVIERSAAFVQLPLPASAYGHAAQASLQDLRIVDARGERVPFALLAPRAPELQSSELQRAATLYPLPPKPAAGGMWPTPVEVRVQGDRISVTSRGTPPSAGSARAGGWLIDLGERQRDDPSPHSVRVSWSGPGEFTAAFGLETSDDLRSWRRGGHGQLMALSGSAGPLTQPLIVLPANPGRFVRLVWADAATAPTLTAAQALSSQQRSQVIDAPAELTFAASAPPPGMTTETPPPNAVHFDLGGVLPLAQLELRLAAGTRVVPAQLQGRQRADDPWRDIAATVFYRLEREGDTSVSPPLQLRTSTRYLRIVPDARAAALDAQSTQLVVHAQLASLVFANQGQPPLVLMAGSANAATSALPLATLVPSLDDERARFGRAALVAWSEVAAVARAEQAQQKLATLRPLLLWAVLLVGVLALAFMVWRLARDKPSTP